MKKNRRIVIKIGTKVIISKDRVLDKGRLRKLVSQIARIKARGLDVILVTSGAIGTGMGLLGMKKRPTALAELQATAAIGQGRLMHFYSKFFHLKGYHVGQILLTKEDIDDRKRSANIKATLETLLKHKVVPIINENDTVATDEIRFGDNDRLARLVTELCGAYKLILLSDVDGLLDKDCRVKSVVNRMTPDIFKLAVSNKCELGTGGMITKLESARRAVNAGIECVIANGKSKDVLVKIMNGECVGTTFKSAPRSRLRGLKR